MINMYEFKKKYSELFTNDYDHSSPKKIRDLIAVTSYLFECNTPQKILDDINILQHAMLTYQMFEKHANEITGSVSIKIPRDFRCRAEDLPNGSPFTFAPTFTIPRPEQVDLNDSYICDFAETIKDVDFCSILLYVKQKGEEIISAQ